MQSPHLRIQEPVKILSQKYQKSLIFVRNRKIYSIDCSPCGKYIACAADCIVISFDLLQQKQIAQSQEQHRDAIWSVRYSPNGKLIASASFDYTIIIWDSSSLNQIGEALQGHKYIVKSVAFSPDSLQLISGSNDESIRIWDLQSQQQVGESIEVKYCISSIEYSHNGLQFLTTGYGQIQLWDSKTKQPLYKLIGHKSYVNKATYSFDDRFIVSGSSDKSIKMWDALSGQQIGDDMVGHENEVRSVAFSPDSTLIVSGSDDKTVRLWNFKTGKQESLLHTHADEVSAVLFTNDGRYVLPGSYDETICMIKICD